MATTRRETIAFSCRQLLGATALGLGAWLAIGPAQANDVPVASLYALGAGDPEVIGGSTFRGVTSNGCGPWDLIEAAR